MNFVEYGHRAATNCPAILSTAYLVERLAMPDLEFKTCSKCGQTKPTALFYERKNGKEGLRPSCKHCCNETHRVYVQSLCGKESKKKASYRYKKTPRGREAERQSKYRYGEKYPERRRAHNQTSVAIRSGRLVRQPCEVCGDEPTHAHHNDYARPLDVRWLCRHHHDLHHKELRDG